MIQYEVVYLTPVMKVMNLQMTFSFRNNFKLTGKLQKEHRILVYPSDFPNVNILPHFR